MAQIKHYDKRVGITYVYESESFYDKEKRQSRSKRRMIGKIDPVTGEMVPTGKRGRASKNGVLKEGEIDYKRLYNASIKELGKKEERLSDMEEQLREKEVSLQKYRSIVRKIGNLCEAPE